VTTPLQPVSAQTNSPGATLASWRNLWRALARIGASALVLALLFRFLPLGQVWGQLRLLPAELWLTVLAGYLLAHTIAISKWRLMVNLAGAGLSYPQAARCYLTGLFATLFLPTILGGDVVRASLALRLGRSQAAVLLGSMLDRILDFASLILLTAVGAAFVPGAMSPASRRIFVFACAGMIVGAALLAGLVATLPSKRFSFRIRRKLVRVRRAWRSMAREPQYVLVSLALAVIVQGGYILLTTRVAEACTLSLPLGVWFFVWPLAKLSALLPVSQGGIGVREAALAALLRPFGARAVLSVAVGLAWEVIIISGGLVAGIASFLLGRMTREG
jgi:glycosyltransferase 2 family protein